MHQQNAEGRTALHYAAKNGLEEMAQLLIVRGAKQTIADKQGKTPHDMSPLTLFLTLPSLSPSLSPHSLPHTPLTLSPHVLPRSQGKTPYDMGDASMRHAFVNAGKDKPKLTKQQRAAIARAARIEREKKKQHEDLLRAQVRVWV